MSRKVLYVKSCGNIEYEHYCTKTPFFTKYFCNPLGRWIKQEVDLTTYGITVRFSYKRESIRYDSGPIAARSNQSGYILQQLLRLNLNNLEEVKSHILKEQAALFKYHKEYPFDEYARKQLKIQHRKQQYKDF